MKRTLIYVWLALVSFLSATAREIAPSEALQNALLALEGDAEANEILQNGANLHLMYTQKSNDKTLFYVFETTEGGFLIASANDNANAVLGYTGNGTFSEALAIPSFKAWVCDCTKALIWVANQPEKAFKEDYDRQGALRSKSTRANLPQTISPLLGTIAWNQGVPYNKECPLVQGTKCPSGCVATAMATLMKYWEWPIHGTGEVSYTTSTYEIDLSANFSQSTYKWNSMLNRYDGEYTDEEADAVAKLMSDVGISIQMDYGPSGSAAPSQMVPIALTSYFYYNKGMKFIYRCYYSSEEWNSIIKGELADKRPVLMRGYNYVEMVGHAFVLDGYNAQGLYHVNWGWGGTSNGYFDVNFMSPDYQGIGGSNGGYVASQGILTDLYPDREGNTEYALNVVALDGLTFKDNKEIHTGLMNLSLIPFVGEAGIIAEKDGVVIAHAMDNFTGEDSIPAMEGVALFYKMDELGLTANQIGEGNKCYVYPAYKDAKGNYVKLRAPVYEADRLAITCKNGALTVEEPEGVSKLSQVSLALDGLAFAGYPLYFNVKVKNEEGAAEFNNLIGVEITSAKGKIYGTGFDCKILPGGSATDFYIRVDANSLTAGSYKANLVYGYYDNYNKVSTKSTTFVVNPAPAAAKLTYSNAMFFGRRVEEGAPVDVTIDVTNTGGYTEHEFAVYLFPTNGGGTVYNVGVLGPVACRITANKQNHIKISGIMDLPPGSYFCQIRDNTIGAWVPNNATKYSFTVTESATGIGGAYEANGPNGAYDLSGRKVNCHLSPVNSQLKKGVYIINGKKVVR